MTVTCLNGFSFFDPVNVCRRVSAYNATYLDNNDNDDSDDDDDDHDHDHDHDHDDDDDHGHRHDADDDLGSQFDF